MMDETNQLKYEIERLKCINAELEKKIQELIDSNFQIVSREKAVLTVMEDKKIKAFQVDVSQDNVAFIGGIKVDELNNDVDTFYVIQKGKVK